MPIYLRISFQYFVNFGYSTVFSLSNSKMCVFIFVCLFVFVCVCILFCSAFLFVFVCFVFLLLLLFCFLLCFCCRCCFFVCLSLLSCFVSLCFCLSFFFLLHVRPYIHRLFPCGVCPCSLVTRNTDNELLFCLVALSICCTHLAE